MLTKFPIPFRCGLVLILVGAFGVAAAQSPPAETSKQQPAKLPEATQSDVVENPVTFRLVQLAAVEMSLKGVDEALQKAGYKSKTRAAKAEQYESNNEMMDRRGGGPVTWDKFYGKTADKFYFHSPGYVVSKERPPQFDYIYRANSQQAQKAKDDVADLAGKIDKLLERKRQLEHQQVALWGQVSASLVAQRELGERPLYTYQLQSEGSASDPVALQRAAAIQAFAQYLRVVDRAMDYVDHTIAKDQSVALAALKQNTETARKDLLRDLVGAISADSELKQQTDPLSDLAKRLAIVSNSAVETRDAALEAEAVGDDLQRFSSRGLLQTAIIDLADKTASLDDGVVKLATDWKIVPVSSKPLPEVKLLTLSSLSTATVSTVAPSQSFFNEKDLSGWEGLPGYWQVREGAIVGAPASGGSANTFNTFLCSKKSYTDFELKFLVLLKNDHGNSGVNFRSQMKNAKNFAVTGPQVEIDQSVSNFPTGSVFTEPMGQPSIPANKEIADKAWNHVGFNAITIRCVGKHVAVTLNGVTTVDGDFPSMPNEGLIAWQLHGKQPPEEVVFKNIQFTDLSSLTTSAQAGQSNRTSSASTQKVVDQFQPGSVWIGNDNWIMTAQGRDGEKFTALWNINGKFVRKIHGTIKDGNIAWYAKDTEVIKGDQGTDNTGKIDGDTITVHGAQRSYTLRLQK